jgi:hypothetical protein
MDIDKVNLQFKAPEQCLWDKGQLECDTEFIFYLFIIYIPPNSKKDLWQLTLNWRCAIINHILNYFTQIFICTITIFI